MAQAEKVPKQMQEVFDSIVALTDEFCKSHLNEEYAQLARKATAALCRKRPSPLLKGTPKSWACGILYALGWVNFLFDKTQQPHISGSDLCKAFGVSTSTGTAKSKAVRDVLKMGPMDPDWSLPSRLEDNPLVWMVMVNGLIVDVRHAPYEIKVAAYEKGLIPYIPVGKEDSE